MTRGFRQTSDDQTVMIEVSKPEGTYRPTPRKLIFETWLDHEPKSVTLLTGGTAETPLAQATPGDAMSSSRGWSYASGLLRVKEDDTFQAMKIKIMR
jgi:hypothetical protein